MFVFSFFSANVVYACGEQNKGNQSRCEDVKNFNVHADLPPLNFTPIAGDTGTPKFQSPNIVFWDMKGKIPKLDLAFSIDLYFKLQ